MLSITRTLCTLIVFMSLVYKSSSIHCYYCNSANNSACVDLQALDDETRGRMIPVVNCDVAIPSPVAVQFFCRKILQTIFRPHHEAEVRVTRGCGWVRHHKECYRADNADHLETVCQCFHDRCNSAEIVDPAMNVGLFLLLASVLYFDQSGRGANVPPFISN